MASTDVEICNIALGRIGCRNFIPSLIEDSDEAKVANAFYESDRDTVLQSFAWPFATRRATLAVITDGERGAWTFAYARPTDCITELRLDGGSRNIPARQRIEFGVEGDAASGVVLLTDQEDAELVYVARIKEVPRFPPLFVDALAWKLASDFALALPVKPNVAVAMMRAYESALGKAGAAELRRAQEGATPPDSEFITVR